MKIVCSIVLMFLAVNGYAVEMLDTIQFRVQYHSKYKYTEEQKEHFDDTDLLEIGRWSSKFYSQLNVVFQHKRDSVINSSPGSMEYLKFMGDMYGSKKGREYAVYKNVPAVGVLTYTDIVYHDHRFRYEEPIETPEWELVEGDTVIIGYSCFKAIGKFRGRVWKAWYAIDLPIDNGPWKLGGLPGLILAADESQGVFSFVATGIEQAKAVETISYNRKIFEPITALKLQSLIQEYWKDQWNTINRLKGLGYSEPPKAQRVFTACFMDYYE